MMDADRLRVLLTKQPQRTALLFDFDGTLSPIVEDPGTAVPAVGAVELLERLAARFSRVAVVSGRPLAFLAPLLPDAVDVSALYGLQSRIDGVSSRHPDADRWRDVIDGVLADPSVPDGVVVEPKGFSLTLHYRVDPAAEAVVRDWASAVAESTGLLDRAAKASIELHPPIEADKGTAVATLASGNETVVFVGDDLGDLPAFWALDTLRSEGIETVKIASGGDELPLAVARAADLVVEGPEAVLALFASLA